MPDAPTFSESWYRVANHHVSLRPGVRVQKQSYRGEKWIVLGNPFSNQFFRLRPAAYELVARLRPDRTVQDAWRECVDRFPDTAPGQEAVLQLLAQLYFANLLQYDQAIDSAQLFERYKKRRQKEVQSRLMNLMFMRFPLIDPDRFLVRTLPVVGQLIRPWAGVIWLAVVGWALKLAADQWGALWDQTQGVLAPGNLPLLFISLAFIKTLHEFGHAFFCRKFGGEVHVMGILLMIFTPVPYVDATSSWGFRSKWQRMLVGAAGMIVELFVAALAMFVWTLTSPGLTHSLAYNLIFIASVSTILFNANPLLRFDGYYLLSDWLEIPNLSQRAYGHLRHLFEYYLFGVRKSESPATSRSEAGWLTVYAICAGIYRVFLFAGILLFVADRFLLLGIIMAVICAVSWVIVPMGRFVHYLSSSPKLDRVRPRAVGVSLAFVGVLVLLLGVIPFPSHFRAPGVVQASERTILVNNTAGVPVELLAAPGSFVTTGQALLRMSNDELELEIRAAASRLEETEARLRYAMNRATADLKPLESRRAALIARLQKLRGDRDALTVRARHEGIWVAPGIREFLGRRLERGTVLGLVVNPSRFEFAATVLQADADVFARPARGAEIRLRGQAGRRLRVDEWQVIPGAGVTLPSPALGWHAGGELAVAADEPSRAAQPFFEVRAGLDPGDEVKLIHGRSGKIRFDLAPEPLLRRWTRRLWQLLQSRYGL